MATDTTAPPRTNTEHWLDLERERRTLESRLKSIVSTQEWLRQQILERWSLDGTSKEKVDGYTIHIQRKLYPKVANRPALTAALIKEGLTDLLTVDEKVLAVWFSAHEEEGKPLPPSIAEYLPDRFERFALAVKLK
jgi:hypothetical protein